MISVKLYNGKTFSSEPGTSLLDSAKAAGITLEYSCRTGRCGVCKTTVLSGDTEALKGESSLTADELAAGMILTCCRQALSNVELDAEDIGALGDIVVKTLPCRIDTITRLAENVVEVVLRVPPTSKLHYLPGQYLDVIGEGGLRRSYSIANAQRADGKLELQIREVEQGSMSQYWFGSAKPNDLLRLEGPLGTFCLRDKSASTLVFLATGTGIAPVKAILEQLLSTPKLAEGKNIRIYWGGRTAADIYWTPQLDGLSASFIPVLSRASADWQGRTGYVQAALLDDAIDLAQAVVYACGSEDMIHSAREALTVAGLPVKHFYSDAFVSSN
ncbi:CDP-6-deoxy-L-threo-D-glycero-4-hexulose-3-dehydrase reductase [Pseudomonas sp. M47T1]|uniref:FAD-binding oxidoreductase n=1 Tax=Pseudomonas sp. M47T1 TaxID=1179778 RepID=UPI0002608031|nr:FAD-binding oxidoreductase [Pseudomonas sp. M47T1]EIK95626.1 CDP-6-deoxy-L-threo-D-glycero-4-hexulose-3-dehydrase reductase [Pseudomonas sp. M47T1]